jgi:Flp pilus assembly protein TadD
MVNKASELTQQARHYEHRFNIYYRSTGQALIAINLAFIHLAKGDADAAVKEGLRAVAAAPDQPLALMVLGAARLQLPDNAGAYAAFRKLVLQDPSNAQAWSNLGVALLRLGDIGRAEIARKRAAKEAEKEHKVAGQPYQIPPKYKNYLIFSLILLVLAATAFAFRTVWDAAKMLRRLGPSPHPY